jgi:anti-sigma factor RsiW
MRRERSLERSQCLVRHWTRGGISFWAVSDLNDVELDQFARALRR